MKILVRKDIMILERIKSLVRIIPILNIIAKDLKLCGHVINIACANFKLNFEGEAYYCCSASCKRQFKCHPKKFAK